MANQSRRNGNAVVAQWQRNIGGNGTDKTGCAVEKRRKNGTLTQKSSILTQFSPNATDKQTIFALKT